MAITAFSNLVLTISDGGTVPSLDYLPIRTYVNIGSGNVLKMSWNTPTATDNLVDSYNVYLLAYDATTASYKPLYSANIGNVNEFYVKSSLFDTISRSFVPLQMYVEAVSRGGAAYNGYSNVVAVWVSRGSGAYIKVTAGYAQPVMKRSLAFAKLGYPALTDSAGNVLTGSDGRALHTKVSSVQSETEGWTLMQECYIKSDAPSWQRSDICGDTRYEALTTTSGEPITDVNNESIYIL